MTERLTEDYFDDMQKITRHYAKSNNIDLNTGGNDFQDIIDKLAEYETAEEEGRLVVLPYKLNETAYLLLDKRDFTEKIIKCRIREISIGFYGMKLSLISEDSMIGHLKWHDVNEIGKTVFFTREEAEKALKEMEVKE